MNVIYGFNKMLGVKPPVHAAQETKVAGGIRQPVHRVSMVALEVVFGDYEDTISRGATVYVNAALVNNQKWATEVFEVDGERFCLLPLTSVSLVQYTAPAIG